MEYSRTDELNFRAMSRASDMPHGANNNQNEHQRFNLTSTAGGIENPMQHTAAQSFLNDTTLHH
jgi:hypothetical protein